MARFAIAMRRLMMKNTGKVAAPIGSETTHLAKLFAPGEQMHGPRSFNRLPVGRSQSIAEDETAICKRDT
jgi:hypothetical protein